MRALAYVTDAGSRTVELVERPDPQARGRRLLVRTEYAGLNPADLMQLRAGTSSPAGSPPDIAGVEVCGVVVACGEAVTRFSPGDRVFGLIAGGGLADRVLVDEDLVVAVPDSLEERVAAAVPESFITAHDALFTQGSLRSGQRVLVHGGSGGVGTAAIALARLAGAEVYATARSASGRELVDRLGATPLDFEGFAARLHDLGVAGVDVVVDLVGAPSYPGNLEVVGPQGRIVAVGLGGGDTVTLSLNALMRSRARLIGTVLRARPYGDKARAVADFAREVVPHLAAGRLPVVIDTVFPVEKHQDAFAHLSSPGRRGNVLLDFAEGDARAASRDTNQHETKES